MSALKKVFSRQLSVVSYLLLAICLLITANLFIFTTPASAAGWAPLSTTNYQDEVAVQRLVRNSIVAGHVALSGKNPLNGQAYSDKLTLNSTNGQITMNSVPGIGPGDSQGGAIGMATNTIASILSTSPASSQEYLANLGENLGIAPKPAYAEGITGSGNNVIYPVLALWKVTRNIAYAGFILVFMAAGMMIMFRQKLNPQTVIGIQQALPGIVVGLILVTFSYFIAALVVDLSFVGTKLVAEMFISTEEKNFFGCTTSDGHGGRLCDTDPAIGIRDTYNKSDAFRMYSQVALRVNNVTDIFSNVWATINPTSEAIPEPEPMELILARIPLAGDETADVGGAGTIPRSGVGGVIGIFISTLASLLVPLILMVALMIQFVKLIIALLMSYIQILLMVIFGPILIMVSAVPGKGGMLSYWLKGLFANALIFPAVFAGFLFAGLLLEWNNGGTANIVANMPMFGGLNGSILKSLLAFGVLLGLPAIPDMIRDAFGVKTPAGFMKAAVGGFTGGANTGKSLAVGGYNQGMEKTGIRAQQQAYQKAKLEAAAGAYPPEIIGTGNNAHRTGDVTGAPTGLRGRLITGRWFS